MAAKKFTPEVQELFLQVLEDTASPKQAAQVCGISRRLAFEYKKEDPEFRSRWEKSVEVALDAVLEEAYRRAVIGVDEPVVYQGQLAMTKDASTGEERPLTVKRHSDRLLEVMLKFRYGEQMADRLRVKLEDQQTGLDAEALLRMPSAERDQLVSLLSRYAGHAETLDQERDAERKEAGQ
jgi:uncharacterized NAD(P)/FAD-binding protein YdhS